MDQLVTNNVGGNSVAWNNNGMITDVQPNTQDGLWQVLVTHGIGTHG